MLQPSRQDLVHHYLEEAGRHRIQAVSLESAASFDEKARGERQRFLDAMVGCLRKAELAQDCDDTQFEWLVQNDGNNG